MFYLRKVGICQCNNLDTSPEGRYNARYRTARHIYEQSKMSRKWREHQQRPSLTSFLLRVGTLCTTSSKKDNSLVDIGLKKCWMKVVMGRYGKPLIHRCSGKWRSRS